MLSCLNSADTEANIHISAAMFPADMSKIIFNPITTILQGLFLLLSKVIFFVEHWIFIESYYRGCLLFTEAQPFWPMMMKIIPRIFINTNFKCPWNIKIHSIFTILDFCILRATISCAEQWSLNFQNQTSWHMSRMPRKYGFDALGLKLQKNPLKIKD
jgi:hypothetical protein